MKDLRVLIVGGSSGVGRATALCAAEGGARVAIAGRRLDVLNEVATAAAGPMATIAGDMRDPGSCERVVAEAIDQLGGLDVLVYTPADLRLLYIEEATAADWQASWETNVVAPALITAAALPHLRRSAGRAFFITSDVIHAPRSALGLYGITKRALEGLCVQLRLEVPEVRFGNITLGPSRPTEMGRVEDYPRYAQMEAQWIKEGIIYRDESTVEDVGQVVASLFTTPVRIDTIVIEPPGGGPR
jgi:NAD(P)-dependent dehydrogenase (short-subunit alcohol dehydrogenase family)